MYGGQYQSQGANNDTSIKLLWGGLVSYIIGFITPQYDVPSSGDSIYTWDLLAPLGLILIVIGIVLTYVATTKAKLFEGVKKYGVTGAVIVLLPILVIQSFKTDVDQLVGSNIVKTSIGYYALWLGVILSMIGSFKAISYPPYVLQGYNQPQTGYPLQPQGYQHNQQTYYPQQQHQQPNYNQQNQQPAVQPPSYINPEPINPLNKPLDITQPTSASQVKNNLCGNCAFDNEVGVKFCVNCGTKFNN